jgi:hypothetical protein
MLLTEMGHVCTELECYVQGWTAFYRVEKRFTELECFPQSGNSFVPSWNAFYRVGMLSTELDYLCTGLECIRLS